MAATVVVKEANGAGPAFTTVSVGSPARFSSSDDQAPGTDHPLVIPGAGLNYSYWKHFCLDLSGDFTKINNVRIYTDGTLGWTLGTSGRVIIGQKDDGETTDEGHGCPQGSYQQSAGTEGTTGYALKVAVNGHAYYLSEAAAVEDLFGFTSGAPCLIDSTDHEEAEKTKFAVLQVEVDTDATQGEQADETITFMYDEI